MSVFILLTHIQRRYTWVYVGLRGVTFIIDPSLRFETVFFFQVKIFYMDFSFSCWQEIATFLQVHLWDVSMYLCSVVNGQLIFSILWTLHLLLLTEFERTNAVVFSFIWVLRLFTLTGHQICFVKLSGISQVPTRCSLATGYGNRRKREEN